MGNNFIRVNDIHALADLISASKLRPVVVFKHSLTCGVSDAAYRELTAFGGEVALVEVQTSREVSREIEKRTGVTHESPQVILLRNGEVVWTASHFAVKADAVAAAVAEHSLDGIPTAEME